MIMDDYITVRRHSCNSTRQLYGGMTVKLPQRSTTDTYIRVRIINIFGIAIPMKTITIHTI